MLFLPMVFLARAAMVDRIGRIAVDGVKSPALFRSARPRHLRMFNRQTSRECIE
jgi:hypothetical protein